jgi:hypothetical protein
VILLLAITLILSRGFTYAKYASNAVFNYYLSSQGFYFDSDDLAYDTKNNTDTMWDGEKVYFTINNSANGSLASETDIKYKVTCTIEEENTTKKCLISGSDSNIYEGTLPASFGCSVEGASDETACAEKNGKWTALETKSTMYFEVIDENGTDVLSANVKIVVESTKPYKKELSATYMLIRDTSEIGELSLKYEKGLVKSEIVVTNSYNENKCVSVSWDSNNFVYDNGNNDILGTNNDDNGNINEVYFMLDKMNSRTLYFYEKDQSVSHDEMDFNIVESNMCQ